MTMRSYGRTFAAGAVVAPVLVAFLFVDPAFRAFVSPQAEVSVDQVNGGEIAFPAMQHLAASSPVPRTTERICRYRGTEWVVRTQLVQSALSSAIEELDAKYEGYHEREANTEGLTPVAQILEKEAFVRANRIASDNTGTVSSEDEKWATRIYSPFDETGQSRIICAIAFETDSGTQLFTMELRDPASILALTQPVESEALARDIERHLPLIRDTVPVDKIENELDIGTSTVFFLRNSCSASDAAGAYLTAVPELQDVAEVGAPGLTQSLERAQTRIQLFHQGDGASSNRSMTIIKIWADKRGNV